MFLEKKEAPQSAENEKLSQTIRTKEKNQNQIAESLENKMTEMYTSEPMGYNKA